METLLTNELVRLRALEPTDLDLLLQWENDPSAWVTGATHTPCSRQRAWQYLQSHDGDLFASGEVRFVVETVEATPRPVGCIDLTSFDAFNRRAEVGILIDEAEREKGYGHAALTLLARYALEHIGMRQLYAFVPEDNAASIALFEGCGFALCGTLRDWLRRGHGYHSARLYQLVGV
ncbi:MAG: GNAT family N-acetyltransferase [Muribaculaceae bacterium]|nr:GNAT family N-acetyltransferase [Muribaculaceae bacterium]